MYIDFIDDAPTRVDEETVKCFGCDYEIPPDEPAKESCGDYFCDECEPKYFCAACGTRLCEEERKYNSVYGVRYCDKHWEEVGQPQGWKYTMKLIGRLYEQNKKRELSV